MQLGKKALVVRFPSVPLRRPGSLLVAPSCTMAGPTPPTALVAQVRQFNDDPMGVSEGVVDDIKDSVRAACGLSAADRVALRTGVGNTFRACINMNNATDAFSWFDATQMTPPLAFFEMITTDPSKIVLRCDGQCGGSLAPSDAVYTDGEDDFCVACFESCTRVDASRAYRLVTVLERCEDHVERMTRPLQDILGLQPRMAADRPVGA